MKASDWSIIIMKASDWSIVKIKHHYNIVQFIAALSWMLAFSGRL